MQKYIVAGVVFGGLASCATIVHGTSQTVAINTPGVPGATCTLSSSSIGTQSVTTPGVVTLSKGSSSVAVRCSKECYNDGASVLASNVDGIAAGNIVFGGVIGGGVDAATGALNQYAPQVDVIMTPNSSCASNTKVSRNKRF